jgi:glycosyltransferase involved in cell wall biosynthesis
MSQKIKSISIVITTRNRKDKLILTLQSILDADKNIEYEIIIIDDASVGIDYDEKIFNNCLIIKNIDQLKLVNCRNIGLQKSKNEIIYFIDDDNIISSEMFSVINSIFEQNPELAVLGPEMRWTDGKVYLNYQRVNLYTGLTSGYIDQDKSSSSYFESDGVPNVFAVRAQHARANNIKFDSSYVQTFTEPEFCKQFNVLGYTTGMTNRTYTRHLVENTSRFSERQIGAHYDHKSYYLILNRARYVYKYGNLLQKIVFQPIFLITVISYVILSIFHGNKIICQNYIKAYIDSYRLIFK